MDNGEIDSNRPHFFISVQVRPGDIDTLLHINNVAILSYFELARVEFYRKIAGKNLKNWDIVIAKIECEYLNPGFYEDNLKVYVKCVDIGETSFVLEYKLVDTSLNKLIAKGRSVQVFIDKKTGKKKRIPKNLRLMLGRFKSS